MRKIKDPAQVKALLTIQAIDSFTTRVEQIGDIGERNLEREMYLLYAKLLKVRKLLTDKETN